MTEDDDYASFLQTGYLSVWALFAFCFIAPVILIGFAAFLLFSVGVI